MPEIFRPSANDLLLILDEASLSFVPDENNYEWTRWCYSSICKHFEDLKNGYNLYLEGDERTFQDLADFAELRIDGPFITIPQKYLYIIDVEINVLCQTHVDPRQHYEAQKIVGVFTRAFKNIISVYKYGLGPLDDGSLIGCFHLQRDLRESININHYGIIRSDTKLTQTTIEGHYRLELWTKGD